MSFAKTCWMRVSLYWGAKMGFCPDCTYLLSDFGEIQYVENIEFLENSQREVWYFLKIGNGKADISWKLATGRLIFLENWQREGWHFLKTGNGKADISWKLATGRLIFLENWQREGWYFLLDVMKWNFRFTLKSQNILKIKNERLGKVCVWG